MVEMPSFVLNFQNYYEIHYFRKTVVSQISWTSTSESFCSENEVGSDHHCSHLTLLDIIPSPFPSKPSISIVVDDAFQDPVVYLQENEELPNVLLNNRVNEDNNGIQRTTAIPGMLRNEGFSMDNEGGLNLGGESE